MKGIFKYFGLALVIVGLGAFLFDNTIGAEIPLLAGLFILFVTKGKVEDERTVVLRSSSAYIALVLGYGFKLISANLFFHQIISFQLVEINHFLILVFALANLLYYLRLYFSWE